MNRRRPNHRHPSKRSRWRTGASPKFSTWQLRRSPFAPRRGASATQRGSSLRQTDVSMPAGSIASARPDIGSDVPASATSRSDCPQTKLASGTKRSSLTRETRQRHATSAEQMLSNSGRPPMEPSAASQAFSGCGIIPRMRPVESQMPAILRCAPLALAAAVTRPWPSA